MNVEISPQAIAGTSPAIAPTAAADRTWTLPGLCWNARVTTSFGLLPVQVVRKFDPLRTEDGAIQRVAWVDKIQLDEGFLGQYPDAQPIMIRAGALGQGLPSEDLLVSPQQRLAVRNANYTAEWRLARDLLGRPGVLRKPQTLLTYYMFHCGQPAKVIAEGVTLYTAP